MIKKINILLSATILVLFANNANSATKDCSIYKHAVDKKICEAQNKQADTNSTSTESTSLKKTSGFFNKIADTLKLKKHKMLREQGD